MRSRKSRYERCVRHLKGNPGLNPYAVCHASVFKSHLAKGAKIEHREHPELTYKMAKMVAEDHLRKDHGYYDNYDENFDYIIDEATKERSYYKK